MPEFTDFCSVYITASDTAEAAWIAKVLVQERLLACANIVPGVQSIYWWEGKITEGHESAIIGKTHQDLLELLAMRTRDLHSYETPCITATPLSYIEPEYEKWLMESLQEDFQE